MKKKLEQDNMRKRSMLYVFLVSMFLLSVLMINIGRGQATTRVSVEPSDTTVEGLPFTINITVQDVEDLYSWQIVLYYNSTILSTREDLIILPLGNIFEGKAFYPLGPYIEDDSKGTHILFGATLSGVQPGVSDSGVLCQINFTGQANGTSWLNLGITTDGDVSTRLIDSNFADIPCEISDGKVTVTGIEKPREPSTITIDVEPSTVAVGSNVAINGTIDPTRAGVNVTICYRPVPGTSDMLATVQTNEFSRYEYNWTTEEAGIYELYAQWPGDADYEGDVSDIAIVTVNKRTSTISLNVHPTNVTVGSSVTINGTITPKPERVTNVTIFYRRPGETWTPTLNWTVQTEIDGVYGYDWITDEAGSYELKASWPGDEKTLSDESAVETIEITGKDTPTGTMTYLFYIIAAIAIIAIAMATIGIYFTKIRKR